MKPCAAARKGLGGVRGQNAARAIDRARFWGMSAATGHGATAGRSFSGRRASLPRSVENEPSQEQACRPIHQLSLACRSPVSPSSPPTGNYKTPSETADFFRTFLPVLGPLDLVDVARTTFRCRRRPVKWWAGAWSAWPPRTGPPEPQGAYTGEISAIMLRDLFVSYVWTQRTAQPFRRER